MIERRIELWTLEGLLDLLEEGETIQKISEFRKTSTNIAEISKKFSQEIKKETSTALWKSYQTILKMKFYPSQNKHCTNCSKISKRQRSISRNTATRYTRASPFH